jgi:hypothetical protein
VQSSSSAAGGSESKEERKTFADEEESTKGDSGFGPTKRGRDEDDATDIDAFKMPKDGEDVTIKKRGTGAPIKDPVEESLGGAKQDDGDGDDEDGDSEDGDSATRHETKKVPYDKDPAPEPNAPDSSDEGKQSEDGKTPGKADVEAKEASGPKLGSPTALNPPLKISWRVVPVKERTVLRANFRNPRVVRAAAPAIKWTTRPVEPTVAKK